MYKNVYTNGLDYQEMIVLWFLVLRTKVVLYEMFLARVQIVDVSESLANVTETTLCNVREGGATISDAATILIFAIKTDVQEPTLSLGVEVSPRYWDLHQYARSLSGLFVFTSCACKDALTYIYIFTSPFSRGSNGQSMLYNVLQAVVERVQDSYRFCRNLG